MIGCRIFLQRWKNLGKQSLLKEEENNTINAFLAHLNLFLSLNNIYLNSKVTELSVIEVYQRNIYVSLKYEQNFHKNTNTKLSH